MNSFEDIQQLWKIEKKSKIPEAEAIINLAAKERTTLRNSILIESGLLFLALLTILFVCVQFHFQYWSTYAGLGLMFFTVTVFTYLRLRLVLQLRKLDFGLPPLIIIPQFKKFHYAQKLLLTKVYNLYVILLNIAFALYFYEVIFHSGLRNIWQGISVTIYLIWMLTSVFYFTAKRTKKENEKANKILKSLQQSAFLLENK